MRKFKLDLDDLQVESFDTLPGAPASRDGTVFGYANTDATHCWGMDCSGAAHCETADNFCGGGGCGTTGNQVDCSCTYGGAGDGTCDATCDTCNPSCDFSCYGMPGCA